MADFTNKEAVCVDVCVDYFVNMKVFCLDVLLIDVFFSLQVRTLLKANEVTQGRLT